jgi:hypothetical protein
MINKKEIIAIVLSTIILSFVLALQDLKEYFLIFSGAILLIILINVLAKKLTAYYWDSEIEMKIWEARQFWYRKHWKLKKPIQIGLLLPIILKILTAGLINWMACLVFETKGKIYKAAKKHGLYHFSEVSEAQIGYIAAIGIVANLFFGAIGYFLGFEIFAKFNLWYAFFNMAPLGTLDGTKIYFGSRLIWNILAVIVLIGVLTTILIV